MSYLFKFTFKTRIMVTTFYICPFERWNNAYKLFLTQDVSEDFYWDQAGALVALSGSNQKIVGLHPLSVLDTAKVKGEFENYSNMICVVAPEVYFSMRNFFQNFAERLEFNSPVDIEVVFLEHNENCVEYNIITIEKTNSAYIVKPKKNIAA